jgi:hypothetical protein
MKDLMSLADKQGYKCSLTGQELTTGNIGADHIQPYAAGGTHEIDNIQLITKEVNTMKGTLSQERFVELCMMVHDHQCGKK